MIIFCAIITGSRMEGEVPPKKTGFKDKQTKKRKFLPASRVEWLAVEKKFIMEHTNQYLNTVQECHAVFHFNYCITYHHPIIIHTSQSCTLDQMTIDLKPT